MPVPGLFYWIVIKHVVCFRPNTISKNFGTCFPIRTRPDNRQLGFDKTFAKLLLLYLRIIKTLENAILTVINKVDDTFIFGFLMGNLKTLD